MMKFIFINKLGKQQLMMLRDRMHWSLFERLPGSHIEHQARLEAQLRASKDCEAANLQLNRRRMFHNFVAEKQYEAKLRDSLEDELDHQDYLERIDRLRKERQQLGKDKLLVKLAETYSTGKTFNYQSDHIVKSNADIKSDQAPKSVPPPPRISESLKQSLAHPSHFKIENEKIFTPSYKYKGRLAQDITDRWVPLHLQGQPLQSTSQKEKKDNQIWFTEIQKQMDHIRNRINIRKQRSNATQELLNFQPLPQHRENREINNYQIAKESKHVSFIEDSNQEKISLKAQKNVKDNFKEKEYQKLQRSYLEIINKKQLQPYLRHPQNKSSNHVQSVKSSPKKQRKRQKKKETINNQQMAENRDEQIRLNSAIQKIKNRLDFSSLVFEDSEHRTVNHQKSHLVNKYDNECKIRKDMIEKICRAKPVAQKYNLILA